MAVAFLSYAGPFNQEFRGSLQAGWREILQTRAIPVTENLNVIAMLCDNATVAEWSLRVRWMSDVVILGCWMGAVYTVLCVSGGWSRFSLKELLANAGISLNLGAGADEATTTVIR